MKNQKSSKQRLPEGTTLVSLLVATMIFSFVAIGLMGLMSINTFECNRTFNRADTLNSGRIALDKIGMIVRSARTFGDIQGTTMVATDPYWAAGNGPNVGYKPIPNNVDMTKVTNGTAPAISGQFPCLADPYYNSSWTNGIVTQTTPAPLPGAVPWPWQNVALSTAAGPPYQLSQDTLIVQAQTFDQFGFPRAIAGLSRMPALDTYVFKIVPDPTQPGPTKWFTLQMAVFPAGNLNSAGYTNKPSSLPAGIPVTLCTNIVGPVDTNGNPVAFQYVDNSTLPATLKTDFSPGSANERNLLGNFSGVICNLQLMKVDAAGKALVNTVRSEFYLRNNASAAVMGN